MTQNDRDRDKPTAVSGGDGSLGGAAIGGPITSPDAGVIRDPVGPAVAIPVTTDPADEPARTDPSVEPATAAREAEDAAVTPAPERGDPAA